MACNPIDSLSQIKKRNILDIYSKRCDVEKKANLIVQQLKTGQPAMGINEPLVDKDGYPRIDIDVHKARYLRNKLALLRTDHKDLSKELEGKLFIKTQSSTDERVVKPAYHQKLGKWIHDHSEVVTSTERYQKSQTFYTIHKETNRDMPSNFLSFSTNREPFAVIDEITNNSPSHKSGIRLNDLLLMFGPFSDLTDFFKLSDMVLDCSRTKTSIPVELMRNINGEIKLLVLNVSPAKWEGNGLLGCHIHKYILEENNSNKTIYGAKIG